MLKITLLMIDFFNMKDSPSLSGSLVKPAAALCHAWAIVSKQMAIPVAGALVLCGRVASKKRDTLELYPSITLF